MSERERESVCVCEGGGDMPACTRSRVGVRVRVSACQRVCVYLYVRARVFVCESVCDNVCVHWFVCVCLRARVCHCRAREKQTGKQADKHRVTATEKEAD